MITPHVEALRPTPAPPLEDGEPALKILFIEDEPDDVELECRYLKREGFEFDWRAVATEPDLRRSLAEYRPNLILCDYSIPCFSGRDALRIARELSSTTPFLFVSGTIGEETAVACLQEGATDYLIKGNLRRLGPAVRRALSDSESRRRTHDIEQARLRLAEILEATPDLVAILDPQGRLTFLNEAGCRILGVERDELLGKLSDVLYAPWARELIRAIAIPQALRAGTWVGETAFISRDRAEIPMSQVILAHPGPDGNTRFFSTIARDIRDRKAYESRIAHLANFDALTGLPNASLFADRVAQAIIHTRRTGRHLAVLEFNLDGFRLINEGFGTVAGDQVLKDVGVRILASAREGDTVARSGFDEFRVLLADLGSPEDAESVAKKILDAIAIPLPIGDRRATLTASAGAAVFPDDGEEAEPLVRNAGAAMHRAKSLGHGGFQFSSASHAHEARERVLIRSGLGSALRSGEIALHYQIQRDLRSDAICGVEALMRWTRPGNETISPAIFIPIAEESGFIRSLGEWSLDQGCRAALEWKTAGPQAVMLGVNVSAQQLSDPGFVDTVARVLRATDFPAERLELEITEGSLVSCQADVLDALARLRALDVKIAIDDFGTGYSSLSYLSRLPADRLKIDQSFVKRMVTDSRDAAIVQAVISLGHGLGMSVIAEGVETAKQLEMLKALGCDQGQGYLFSAAVPEERMPVLLGLPARVP